MSGRDWSMIGREQSNLPPWAIWTVPPVLAPLGVIAWMAAKWDQIPLRYPVHFRSDGVPNGWETRTPLHVFGFPIFAAGLVALLTALMWITWYGSRRSATRSPMDSILLAATYTVSAIFSIIGLMPVFQVPGPVLIVIIPLVAIGLIVYVVRKQSEVDDSREDTPKECWSLGGIYYNPADPALFVRARFGGGYTLNMANRSARAFMAALMGGMGALIAFLIWSQR